MILGANIPYFCMFTILFSQCHEIVWIDMQGGKLNDQELWIPFSNIYPILTRAKDFQL